ncbi:MAG: hypothetical protein GX629_12565 [Phycisphaerae bacterium]|jgi:hypothetical protein|nr:hypothetical protein [Phycisphaerae bacterium]
MGTSKGKGPSETLTKQSTGAGCLVRLGWMMFGHLGILISAKFISSHKGSFISTADFVFWGIVFATIGLRYLDVRKMDGMTVTGEPASMKHWKMYSLILVAAGLVLWGLAHWWAAYR